MVALETGEVDEWHFISNTRFSNNIITKVEVINTELKAEHKPTIKLHQHYDWR